MRSRRLARVAPALLILFMGGCGAGNQADEASRDSVPRAAPAAGQTTVATVDSAPFAGTTEPVERRSSSGIAVLDAVRTARHARFERVVFVYRDSLLPGYRVEYASAMEACGSGDPVTTQGTAVLAVRMTPAEAHEFDGERAKSTIPERRVRVGYPVLREMALTCDFEAEVTWAIGLSARRPYRVLTLESPPRLVVDIRADSVP